MLLKVYTTISSELVRAGEMVTKVAAKPDKASRMKVGAKVDLRKVEKTPGISKALASNVVQEKGGL